jgi:hypothetical protein
VHKKVGIPQVAVVLGNLILQNQVVTEGIPGKISQQTVVLVQVLPVVRKDDIGRKTFFNGFKCLLHVGGHLGQKSVTVILYYDFLFGYVLQERLRTFPGFPGPFGVGSEDHPLNGLDTLIFDPFKQGSAAPDFDIVAVCTEAQYLVSRFVTAVKVEMEHVE